MKRFFAILLVLTAAFTLFSCDDGTQQQASADDSENVTFVALVTGINYNSSKNYFLATEEVTNSEYRVAINSTTEFVCEGSEADKSSLSVGDTVKITYNGIATRSIPAHITAIKVEITARTAASDSSKAKSISLDLSEDTFCMIASVTSVSDSLTVEVTYSEYAAGTYVIYVSSDTEITDANGEAVSLSDIEIGDSLYIEYGSAVTLSLPPQTAAIKIIKQ